MRNYEQSDDNRKECSKCYDYNNPNTYWDSFYLISDLH